MATIINQVSFQNFFNYYGPFEDNTYEFSEGVNIVVADNGGGKSKFFNGFLWIFYDEILDSDSKTRKNIKSQAVKVCSDKAKNEAAVNDLIECNVAFEFSDKRYRYRICKGFKIKKSRSDSSLTDSSDWQVFFKGLEVSKRDLQLLEFHEVYEEDEHKRILNKLIQPNLREYSLFQGEEVDKLIDFNQADSLNRAVKTLTDINKYDELEKITKYVADRAEKDLNERLSSNNAASENYKKKLEEKDSKKNSLESEIEKLQSYEHSYSENKAEVDKLESLNENAEARKEFDDKIKDQNSKLKILKDDYDRLVEKLNERFYDGNFGWIAMGCEKEVTSFKEKLNRYREERTIKKAVKLNGDNNNQINLLPPDSPDSVTLQTMVEREHCYVCNREAHKDSEPWKYIVSLLNRKELGNNRPIQIFKNDLNDFFGDIQLGAQSYVGRIAGIQDSILKTREKEQELLERITRVKDKIKNLKDERSYLIIGDEDDMTDARQIMAQYRGAISRMQKSEDDIIKAKNRINSLNESIRKDENELGRMRPQNSPKEYEVHLDISADIRDAARMTRIRVFDNMILKLEKEANQHFQNLIKYNEIAGGILKFQKNPRGIIDFNYIDEEGNEVTGASEGFQRMKVLAVLMAVISVNPNGYLYPLLADAPLSAFGQGFIKGFFEETEKVFPQSIILIKDLYDRDSENKLNKLGNELIKNDSVSTVYLNQIPKNLKQVDVYTENKKIK
ncbi:AAA family ATPase [Algoriphagus persicinus]|uniref:AAA family ATPase n=1 Tax=Algoriphagus persicinus TaxID=3108754 RepID=UPI002B373A54|nr:AAA family ATPase [Algoriphagus sp. E1-3-M2]MEB2786811.1 AAA family ATPase [Algoriphagus sp. E1-3-M2]